MFVEAETIVPAPSRATAAITLWVAEFRAAMSFGARGVAPARILTGARLSPGGRGRICMDATTPAPAPDTAQAPTPTGNAQGESLLAVMGVACVLDADERPYLTVAKREAAAKLPATIAKHIRAFLSAETFERGSYFETVDYLGTMTALQDRPNAAQLVDQFSEFSEDADETAAFCQAAGGAVEYLTSVLPLSTRDTVVGPRAQIPCDQLVSRFRRAYTIVNDPMHALVELREGILGHHGVSVLVAVYPGIYGMIQAAVFDELARLGTNAKWEPRLAVDRQLRILMQAPTMTPGLAAELQKHFSGGDDKGGQGGGGGRPAPDLGKSYETPTQRIADK